MSELLTGSEAVFGFCAWLSCRKTTVVVGAKHSAGEMAELAQHFCNTNKLPEPRDNWTDYLTHPTK